MSRKIFVFFFLLPFFACFTFAFDCNRFFGLDYDNCVSLNVVDEDLIANLIYSDSTFPNHEFIRDYNANISVVDPPFDTSLSDMGVIRDGWVEILSISPSVWFENVTYVPRITSYRVESGYNIVLPEDYYDNNQVDGQACQVLYNTNSDVSSIIWFVDGSIIGFGNNFEIDHENYSKVESEASINAVTRADSYVWHRYCCRWRDNECVKHCYQCSYHDTSYINDNLVVRDTVFVKNYPHYSSAKFTIVDNYVDTFRGFLGKDDETNVLLRFNRSYFKDQEFEYFANFSSKPYYFLHLIAKKKDLQEFNNLIVTNNTFYVSDASSCSIESSDFFTVNNSSCDYNITQTEESLKDESLIVFSIGLIFKLFVFVFILWLFYKLIKAYWGKALISIIIFLLLSVPALADEDCGITNLASCIPQKIFDFLINLMNAPLEPLLNMIKNLFESAPQISLFQYVWTVIVYCISFFYGLLFVYSGFQFLFSGHDVLKREMAKEWLKNTVMMIVLVQASYYLYGLFVQLGSLMTSAVLSMVDEHFFMITADNWVNVGLEFLFILVYVLILLITLILLTIRYLIVAFGVLFVPIGIFCYFIPPLKSFGEIILNMLGMLIFVTFLDAIIILACSMLITIPLFENFKILVMITCFLIINASFIMLGFHIITKTSLGNGAEKIAQAVKYVGGKF